MDDNLLQKIYLSLQKQAQLALDRVAMCSFNGMDTNLTETELKIIDLYTKINNERNSTNQRGDL